IGPDGYVYIVGRGKDLVISGGYNVYPKEVETEIDAIPGVIESAVIGCPHKDFGEGVTAVIVKRPGATLDVRRRATAQHHGQGAEERIARPLQGHLRDEEDGLRRQARPGFVIPAFIA